MAQMMRVFVATPPSATIKKSGASSTNTQSNEPKAISKISISIAPKVQPHAAPCPIFVPTQSGPIELAENNLWVLRLPYDFLTHKRIQIKLS
jgi:hypothetical protein